MNGAVAVTDDGAVRTIRLNRPEKKNALTLAMYADMTRTLRESNQSDAVRCIVIAGAPGVFCAGNDIGDFLGAAMGGGLDTRALDFMRELVANKKPLVAAVGGVAVGIGTTLLLHCDHVVASTDALLSTPFLKLGLIPELGSTLLAPLRMGHARAFSLLAMGRPLSAAEAKDAGIVNTVVEAADLEVTARQAAREIAALPVTALATAREMLRGPADAVLARIEAEAACFAKLLQSDEARTAFQAFFARKK